MRSGTARLAVIVAVLGLAAASCAKSTNAGSAGSSTPTASASAGTPVALSGKVTNKGTKDLTAMGSTVKFTLEADNDGGDFYFSPTFLKVAPGSKITLELENEGSTEHNFTIEALGINEDLAKGAKKSVTVTMPSSGALNFFCEYHHNLGMQGAFFSAAGQALVPAPAGSTSSSPASSPSGYGY